MRLTQQQLEAHLWGAATNHSLQIALPRYRVNGNVALDHSTSWETIMQLNMFLKVHAVIALVFGIGFILMPATILSFYSTVPMNELGAFMSRLFGSAILTYAAVLWFASDTEDSPAKKAIVKGFFLTMVIAAAVALHFQLTGPINALGWSTVALYVFLAAMYGRFHMSAKN